MHIPYQQIVNQLGLKEDDILLIASDITKLVYTSLKNKEKFDSNLFIDSFKEKLTEGTLLFPSFSDSFKSGDVFERTETPPEMGALSKVAFNRADFKRNWDPLHSFLATGKRADEISVINPVSTFGNDSVFAFLHHHKAKMLMIDVDLQHSFTYAHYVEENQLVSHRKYATLKYKTLDLKGVVTTEKLFVYTKKKGIVNTLNKLESIFISKDAMVVKEINNAVFSLIDLEKAYEIIYDDIRSNKARSLYRFDKMDYLRLSLKALLGK